MYKESLGYQGSSERSQLGDSVHPVIGRILASFMNRICESY